MPFPKSREFIKKTLFSQSEKIVQSPNPPSLATVKGLARLAKLLFYCKRTRKSTAFAQLRAVKSANLLQARLEKLAGHQLKTSFNQVIHHMHIAVLFLQRMERGTISSRVRLQCFAFAAVRTQSGPKVAAFLVYNCLRRLCCKAVARSFALLTYDSLSG